MHFTEDMFEQAVIELFENMGYTHIYAPDMDRDYSSPLLEAVLQDSLVKLNKGMPLDAINEAISKLRNFDTGSLLQKNMQFMDYLQNGIPVRYFVKGEERNSIVYLIDYKIVSNNSFYVVNQFTYIENGNNRRPDIILFINGLPLVSVPDEAATRHELVAKSTRYANKKLRELLKNSGDIPTEYVSELLIETSQLAASMEPKRPSITTMTALDDVTNDIIRRGLSIELEGIREMYEAGRISRTTAKRMRENVALMQIDLEDKV